MALQEKAAALLRDFKGADYAFGLDVLGSVGSFAADFGESALIIANTRALASVVAEVVGALEKCGVKPSAVVSGSRPNSPKEDVYRLAEEIAGQKHTCLIVIGGGSSIDAAKAANLLAALEQPEFDIEPYFGTGLAGTALAQAGKSLTPLIAVQTAAGSAAHLTKYSNVTDVALGQKKLIVDEVLIPARAVFDYKVTATTPHDLTIDGALDTIAHCIEVFYGCRGGEFGLLQEITATALELVFRFTKRALQNPQDYKARQALGLASDLGGWAIMLGGTNGAHLTSFSLIDAASHGRACGIMNPYYTVFFAPAVEKQLRVICGVLQRTGFLKEKTDQLTGRELGLAAGFGLINFSKSIGAPTTLGELPNFGEKHIERALSAAKDPQLAMKLRNMPIALNADLVDEYMKPILLAAKIGDFSLIKNTAGGLSGDY